MERDTLLKAKFYFTESRSIESCTAHCNFVAWWSTFLNEQKNKVISKLSQEMFFLKDFIFTIFHFRFKVLTEAVIIVFNSSSAIMLGTSSVAFSI